MTNLYMLRVALGSVSIPLRPHDDHNYIIEFKKVKPLSVFAVYLSIGMSNPFLFEPYNAYQKPPRKKHWMEVAEEEALMARIIAEQQAQQTQPPQQQTQMTAVAAGAAGGGGVPNWEYFNPGADIVDFSASPSTGVGPLTVTFTNLTTSPTYDTYLWNFGDGQSSTLVNPTHTYSNTGSYTASLTVSYQDGTSTAAVASNNSHLISASVPTLLASILFVSSSVDAPATGTFTDGTYYNGNGTLTYFWDFGSGSITSSAASPGRFYYLDAGGYTASLQVTESSYGGTSTTSRFIIFT